MSDDRDREVAVRRAVTDADREARLWLADHDALPRADLDAVGSAFRRTVGEPAGGDVDPGLRLADAGALGVFAFKHDVVLYELADDVAAGRLFGYPAGAARSGPGAGAGRWVPLLACAPGPAERAAGWIGAFADAAETAVGGDLARP